MSEKSFLQSQDWGRFQLEVGHTVIPHDGYQFFETTVPFGKYLYCPHPTIASAQEYLASTEVLAKQEQAWFVRVEPNEGSAAFPENSSISPTLSLQPEHTWHVPLADDATMQAAMHQKTRYNIRVAEKNGVKVSFSQSPDAVAPLLHLLKQTADRAEIRLHPASYYQKMLQLLGADPFEMSSRAESERSELNQEDKISRSARNDNRFGVEVALAEHDGVNVAGALLGWWGDTVIYLHGGSNYERRSLMAPHLLHWTAMQRARDAGRTTYDMGGVSPEGEENHQWAGISRFKRGFGGQTITYPPAVDIVYNKLAYQAYGMARKFRRSIR